MTPSLEAKTLNVPAGKETLLLTHKEYYATQVALFRPLRLRKDKDREAARRTSINSDTLIATRIRPLLAHEIKNEQVVGVVARDYDDYVDVHELRNKVIGKPAVTTSSFQFDRTYGPDSTSEIIYQDLVAPLVPWTWGGGISTLFAYGQTGSGKTFTIDSLAKQTAAEIFSDALKGERNVFLSCIELAGNVASDLLNDRYTIKVMEDGFGETQLVGAREHRVGSARELLNLIDLGMSFRRSAATLKNDASSRTHAICKIKIVNKDILETPDGLLFLVDLAGSESATDVKDHTQERMKESREINSSLSILKDCIRGRSMWHIQETQAVASGSRVKQAHIPFRSSTLTKVLKHVFDTKGSRHCKTSIIACVGSSYYDAAATKNTFRYAEMLCVPYSTFTAPKHNDEIPSTWTPEFVKEWIEKNSGVPSIDALILAPTENGIQLCQLPAGEFISRCMKTPKVDENQACAFYSKLSALHIDSRKRIVNSKLGGKQLVGVRKEKAAADKPFVQRLRAGMFVQMRAKEDQVHIPIFMLMSPESGFNGMYLEGSQRSGNQSEDDIASSGVEFGKGNRFICAEISPSPMPNAYEIDIRRQHLIGVDEMEKELLMEYDSSTRFYYMTV